MWLDQPPIKLVDATLLDSFTATHLNPDATVWVTTGLLKPGDMERAKEMDLEVVALDGATVLRQADPRQAPAAQLDLLLAWSENQTIHEGIVATRTLLNEDFAASKLGENILPPLTETWTPVGGYGPFDSNVIPDRWTLWPRTSDGNGSGVFTLDGGVEVNKPRELNVTLTTHRLVPGKSYVLLFQYRNTALTGTQRVYVSMHGDDGSWLDTYPRGEGYLCAASTDSGGAFDLLVPANTTKSVIWLRIDGTGSAQYSSVELREILP